MSYIDVKNPLNPADRKFLTQAMNRPLLTPELEKELALRWRDQHDEAAMHQMVSAYVRLVVASASRFRGYGLSLTDLVQEGNVGLLQAAARFDPDREVRFATYATWWIRAAMQEYILRNWSIVRAGTSAGQKALFFKLRWLRAKIEGSRTPESAPAREVIAHALKVSVKDVDDMSMRLGGRDQSLNEPVGEEGVDEWQDFLVDTGPSPEDIVVGHDEEGLRGRWLAEAITELNPREQLIVRRRFLEDDKSTLEEIGVNLGITKERVRQIEHKAFEKLRHSVLRQSRALGASPAA